MNIWFTRMLAGLLFPLSCLTAPLLGACEAPTISANIAYMNGVTDKAVCSRSLSGVWRFARENHLWCDVSVPHDWAIAGPFDPLGSGHQGKLPWKGIGRYERSLMLTEEEQKILADGGRAYLEFDGVMARPAVTVNGHSAGGWDYGYMGFVLEVTKLIAATNRIEVVADTTTTVPRWYIGAGIYRDVKLHVKGGSAAVPLSVKITTPVVGKDSARVCVEWERVGGGRRRREFDVPTPRLWDVRDPHLYKVDIAGEVFRYGIRKIEWTAEDGFHLNGRRVQLKGVCLHSDFGPLGAAYHRDAARRQLLLMKDMGANAVRTSHNAQASDFLDLCDELGLLVYDECFDGWDETAGRRPDEPLEPYVERNLVEWVRRDRNHPSVICWSMANEQLPTKHEDGTPWKADGVSAERVTRFRDVIRSQDATRPVTVSHNFGIGWGCLDAIDLNDGHYGASYHASKRRHPTKPTIYSETASALSSYGFYQFPRPVDEADYAVVERECDGYDETRSAALPEVEFLHLDEDRYCAGEFVWTGIDYLGEPVPYLRWRANPNAPWHYPWKRGRNTQVDIPTSELARSSYFGICDLTGVPKDRYWLYRSVWNAEGETCHVLPHWNWGTARGVTNLPVVVYASGDEAELFLNGRSLGRRRKGKYSFVWNESDCSYYPVEHKKDNYRFLWENVVWEPGEIRAVAYRGGKKLCSDAVRTCGRPKSVALSVDPYSCGRLIYVQVDVVDGAGIRDPWATNRVSFALRGPGRILAVGNGSAHAHDSFGDVSGHSLFYGKAMAIVRREGSGELVLTAQAEGLEACSLHLPEAGR